MYTLQNDSLYVRIADPEEAACWTSRFDVTGFITDVVLNHVIHFTTSEPRSRKVPSSGGRGLCSAYRFDAFDEVKPGEWAPRFGVGLIKKKEDKGFQNSERYECEPFPCETEQISDTQIRFRTLPIPCLGYAAETSRMIRIENNSIYMDMELRNTGEREIAFGEFCHNFLTMDGMALGPDYQLELQQVCNLRQNIADGKFAEELYEIKEHRICPRTYTGTTGFAIFEIGGADMGGTVPFQWKLSHEDAGISVEGSEIYLPAGMAVWCRDHMLCPEVTYRATVKPGESTKWRRSWTFMDEADEDRKQMRDRQTNDLFL